MRASSETNWIEGACLGNTSVAFDATSRKPLIGTNTFGPSGSQVLCFTTPLARQAPKCFVLQHFWPVKLPNAMFYNTFFVFYGPAMVTTCLLRVTVGHTEVLFSNLAYMCQVPSLAGPPQWYGQICQDLDGSKSQVLPASLPRVESIFGKLERRKVLYSTSRIEFWEA